MKRSHFLIICLLMPVFIFLFSKTNYAQVKEVKYLPVQSIITGNSYVEQYRSTAGVLQDPINYITIFSTSKNVYSVCNGTVKGIVKFNEGYMILIEKQDSIFVYSYLDKPFFENGDKVIRGEKIGEVLQLEGSRYELEFGISIMPGIRDLNYIQLQKYLTGRK